MGGTPVLIIGRTCDTLFKRLMEFGLFSHLCFVFLFEEWVLEIVCDHFCCYNSTNPISTIFFIFFILYYIDLRHYLLHLNKRILFVKTLFCEVSSLSCDFEPGRNNAHLFFKLA